MTATEYQPLRITKLNRAGWLQDEIDEGQGVAMGAVGFTIALARTLPDNHPGMIAWEHVVDETITEISPQIRDLVYKALQRRLPWAWEPPERPQIPPAFRDAFGDR